ncbi:hypothetical protein SETIT_6G060900v2 [Setaria italica]|uniref:Uncharacterized protein n=2 Tax=Setaria TaxID=4554 RepID=A0A368RIY9_SETIT|nr:hypothetical protein SETIT_6G060900v2 [Setaria italica]TKW08950.1 hypothetical protein SEVIR_6G058400v2 [Setaria viridis]
MGSISSTLDSDALVYLSWFLLELVSYLLLVSFSKYYGYAILPVPLPIVAAVLQLKFWPGVMQQIRTNNEANQNADVENADQDHNPDVDESHHFDSIFELSGNIVNCAVASSPTVVLTPHVRYLAILLKILLVITLITALIHRQR